MKDDTTTKYIKTLNYGYLPIRYNKAYLFETVDTIETCDGKFYEVRKNQNGKLVAVEA